MTESEELTKQALVEHLADLRKGLIHSLLAVALGFALAYNYSKEIGVWFFKPLLEALPEHGSLIFTSYQEGFFFT